MRRLSCVLVAAVLAAAAFYTWACLRLPRSPRRPPGGPAAFEWKTARRPPDEDWSVFAQAAVRTFPVPGDLGERFRLAGTFFAFDDARQEAETFRKAILDDLSTREQRLVAEGDVVEGIEVVRIFRDRIVLRTGGREEELWLSFADVLPERPERKGAVRRAAAPDTEPALEVNRFGKRVGENRWVFTRDALMGYYTELLDDPERIAALYASMKPDYADGAIAGYSVDIEGEEELFKAADLRQGDVVRKVNSMKMSSQRHAEYFISEFVNDRISAIVLDIERDGKPQKLIYLIR